MPQQPFPADAVETSGPSLRLVLGTITVLVLVLGVLAYWRYSISERVFAEAIAHFDARGKELDTEGCVAEVLEWHRTCEANKALCDNGVVRIMSHCLTARDRTETCSTIELGSAKAQWVFHKCLDRGSPCVDRKKCACADAYRTIDSFCRHEQRGVSL
ncbi:MAG TPA: hypothetical protein VFG69_16560 [Nannocystaceae bacterium]|nr:hypothetical protein [Nannocystaceae bacterium]